MIIALPANKAVIEIFEKAITAGFSSAKTRLVLDKENLMPSYTAAEYGKVPIDQRFHAYKGQDLKVACKMKLDDKDKYHDQRIISKVLRLDENNQYGGAMTKLLPFIKE